MLIQIHILQNYAPSNLNRDDTGSPKDAIFGGYRRGRISSQCLKRSIRKSEAFQKEFLEEELLGVRTRLLPDEIAKVLLEMKVDESVIGKIVQRIPDIGKKQKKSAEEETEEKEETTAGTRQLIFLGKNEIQPLAVKLLELYLKDPKGWAKVDFSKELPASLPRSVDIAMFGRMTTSAAFEDVQAAVQVAHAISANTLTQEFDYFTAVDDLSGESGAGMIGDIEFNSSTYYKYINIHWEGLQTNLGGNTIVAKRSVIALLEAAITAQPSGKQNTFAAFNLPELVLVEVSERNLPVSYVNAFIKPAKAGADKSLVESAAEKLSQYIQKIHQTYRIETQRAYTSLLDIEMPEADAVPSVPDLKRWLEARLPG